MTDTWTRSEKSNSFKLRNYDDPLEPRWDVWLTNGDRVSIQDDRAYYKEGVLSRLIAVFKKAHSWHHRDSVITEVE